MDTERMKLLWGNRPTDGNPYVRKPRKPKAKTLKARDAGPARVARLGGAVGKGGTAGQKRDRLGRFA